MPEFCNRLKNARENLGLSQQALAERCGVTARSQRNYESGERLPDAAYLAALAAAGVDVLYVLTSQRMGGKAASDPAEQVLLDSYRRCAPAAKANLIQTAALLAAGMGAGAESAAQQSNTGAGAVQILGSKNRVSSKKN